VAENYILWQVSTLFQSLEINNYFLPHQSWLIILSPHHWRSRASSITRRRFKTDVSVSIIQTVDLPDSGPRILGVSPSYILNDRVSAVCISPLSSPPSKLQWYINHDTADPGFVSSQTQTLITDNKISLKNDGVIRATLSPLKYDSGLGQDVSRNHSSDMFSVLNLNFVIREKQFKSNNGKLQIKCTASIDNVYWRSSEVTSFIRRKNSWLFSASPCFSTKFYTIEIMSVAFLHSFC